VQLTKNACESPVLVSQVYIGAGQFSVLEAIQPPGS